MGSNFFRLKIIGKNIKSESINFNQYNFNNYVMPHLLTIVPATDIRISLPIIVVLGRI